jgi:tetratricopeptide (TPR) repeat protein
MWLGGCSSAPKQPLEVLTSRNMAASQLDLANRTANQGRYSDALLILEDARKTAAAVDDPVLLIKTAITGGNILFALGRHDEAFDNWEAARREGEAAGERDLAVQARIYAIRGRLTLLVAGTSGDAGTVEKIRDEANQEISSIKSDNLSRAAGWLVVGMAEKELGRYAEAESALQRALDIHEKARYLEEAAYDWFLIASVRSVSGHYAAALEALWSAIGFDRRAENSFGLASSWQAMGEVYAKAGSPEESAAAFRRAAGIYRAMGLESRAAAMELKVEN